MTVRVAVLASGTGTNLQALIDARHNGLFTGDIVCVVSDKPDAVALQRAQQADIATAVVTNASDESRTEYDARLAECLTQANVDLVVLAGFMRLLSMTFLSHFPMRVINLHPALPGEFPGTHAIERAFAEKDNGRTASGVMVHFVPDEGIDNGPVIAYQSVPLHISDSFEDFSRRIHTAEHQLLVSAVQHVVEHLESNSLSSITPKEISS